MTTDGHITTSATFQLLTNLTQTMGDIRAKQDQIAAVQATQNDTLIRFDERSKGWATKTEVNEVASEFRFTAAAVEAKTTKAHERIDELRIDHDGTVKVVGRHEKLIWMATGAALFAPGAWIGLLKFGIGG